MPTPYSYRTLSAAMSLSFLASGCVFYPKATTYNDPECNKNRYQLELAMGELPGSGGTPADCLAAMLAIGPLTLAVSEPVVLLGNTALWLEKQGENYWLTRQGRCGNRPVSPTSPLLARPEDHSAPLAPQYY